MPEQTLAAWLKKQIDDRDLTEREKVRLVRIIDECIERYAKVRDIQKGLLPEGLWGEAARGLQTSLQNLSHYDLEIPLEILAVIGNGPQETIGYYGLLMMNALYRRFGNGGIPEDAFVEVAKVGLLYLGELRGVLQETKLKGTPGRKPKYVQSVILALQLLRESGSDEITAEICNRCKKLYPAEFKRVNAGDFRAFKRSVREAGKEKG